MSRDWAYWLGTSDIREPPMKMEFETGEELMTVYNLKDKKKYRVRLKDISTDYDFIWFGDQWRYIMRKNSIGGFEQKWRTLKGQ